MNMKPNVFGYPVKNVTLAKITNTHFKYKVFRDASQYTLVQSLPGLEYRHHHILMSNCPLQSPLIIPKTFVTTKVASSYFDDAQNIKRDILGRK